MSATYLQYLQPAQVLLASKLHCAPGSLARHTPVGTAPPTRRRHRSLARTPILEELHLWALLGYTCVTGTLALICLLCAHQLQKAHDREAAREAREARRGDYAPWSVVTENGPRAATYARIAAYAFAWWALSVSFTLVNKYFLYYWKPPTKPGVFVPPGFPFAVTTTTLHLTMKVVLSTLTIRWRQYR